jgi:hypothetical protein
MLVVPERWTNNYYRWIEYDNSQWPRGLYRIHIPFLELVLLLPFLPLMSMLLLLGIVAAPVETRKQ